LPRHLDEIRGGAGGTGMKGQATIGDALIFLTKMVTLCIVVVTGFLVWVVVKADNHSQLSRQLSAERVKVASVAGDLKSCADALEAATSLPEGYVLDQR
jgi:hypothetical protein